MILRIEKHEKYGELKCERRMTYKLNFEKIALVPLKSSCTCI